MIEMYQKGASDIEICSALKLSEREFENRYKTDEIFCRLVQIGRLHAKAWWFALARDNLHDRAFKVDLWIAVMRNRWGWTDSKSKVEEAKPDEQLSPEELQSEIDRLLKKRDKKFANEPITDGRHH